MTNQKITKRDDIDPSFSKHTEYNSSELLGTWYNCDKDTSQIYQIDVYQKGDELFIKAKGANKPDPIEWDEVKIKTFVKIPDVNIIGGFTCKLDYGFMETEICSNVKLGILVIQSYNAFKDGSGRPNYYAREFFNK